MGISMLGGIVSSILNGIAKALLDGLSSLFSSLINWIILPILKPIISLLINIIVVPLVEFVFTIVNYILSLLWYTISIFILGLIDYVELLFRLLAGLPVEGASLSLNGESGDLVIQLIKSDNIKQVFLSMCIVGIFLLVITTIFQIIKVEYTTEGAKNAKGPILNKAFKGLCNMVMIPALCICGVFIGNKVLDLLDTATKLGGDTSISRMLFVTAASGAEYEKGETKVYCESTEIGIVLPAVSNVAIETFIKAFSNGNFGDKDKDTGASISKGETQTATKAVSDVASKYLSKTDEDHKYFKFSHVTNDYNYSRINYLVLIASGCIILKTLYFACFGMVVRLYQCGMLFIISPAVIGMTPVRESGLSKWREEFIGQAISAYGVILALNIFFILAGILTNISLTFTTGTGTKLLSQFYFTSNFMTYLLKTIIIIGGAVSIEKFSSQIGSYFGAKDAISQGKEMEKGVTDTAKKAVGTAVQVGMMATGVGGAAMGAVKSGAKGIAGGVKGLAGAMKDGAADGGGLGGALKSGASYTGKGLQNAGKAIGKGAMGVVDAGEKVLMGMGIKSQTTSEFVKGKKLKKDADAANEEYNISEKLAKNADTTISSATTKIEALEAKKKANGGKLSAVDQNQLDFWNKQKTTAEGNKARFEKATESKSKADTDYSEYVSTVRDRRIMNRERSRQAGISFFKEKTFLGQTMSGVQKQVSGFEDAAAKDGGDQAKAALEHLKKVESKAKEDDMEKRNAADIKAKDMGQAQMAKSLSIEECNIKNAQLDLTAQSGLANLNNLQARYEQAADPAQKAALASQIESLRTSLQDRLGLGANDIVQDVNGNFKITGNYKIDTRNIEKMFDKIFSSPKGMNDKQAIEEAIKEAVQGKSAEQAKQIQEIFERVLQKYTKG